MTKDGEPSASSDFHPALTVTNIKNVVPLLLDMEKTQYSNWVELFENHCCAYDVLDHIDPQTPRPKEISDRLCKRLDAMVKQWIYSTISPSLVQNILSRGSTAQETWDKIQSLFQNNKHSRAVLLDNKMKKEIYNGAVSGKVELLRETGAQDVEMAVVVHSDDDLVAVTSHGNNIIHLAAENGHLEFIKEAFTRFSSSSSSLSSSLSSAAPQQWQQLITAKNNDGDTALHLAAKLPDSAIAECLIEIEVAPAASSLDNDWKNKKGNTPLHLALMNGGKSLRAAASLLRVHPDWASCINHRNETPLHLAVDYYNQDSKVAMKSMMNKLNGLGASMDYTECLFAEKSMSMIEELLKKVAITTTTTTTIKTCCLRDKDGRTPLIRATINSFLPAVEAIIKYCPESVEITDFKGRNFLHHIRFESLNDAEEWLRAPGISPLMDRQDEDGKTPLFLAVMKHDYVLIKAMIQCNANCVIKSVEGTSPLHLIQSDSTSFPNRVEDNIGVRRIRINDEEKPKSLFEAAYRKDWATLINELYNTSDDDKDFISRLPDGSNIIHVAVQCCSYDYNAEYFGCSDDLTQYSSQNEEFVVKATQKFPILHCQTDLKGRTPLHYAMYHSILTPGGIAFREVVHYLKEMDGKTALPPWEIKDDNGNTLLHLALMFNRLEFAKMLIKDLNPKLVQDVNNNEETPLHLFCRNGKFWGCVDFSRDLRASEDEGNKQDIENEEDEDRKDNEMIELLYKTKPMMVYSYDADGFTPLMRAVENSFINVAERILEHCPQSINQFHSKSDGSVLHLMNLNPNNQRHRDFCELPQMQNLLGLRDRKGNTPLHLAIKQGRFGTAHILMDLLGCTNNAVTEYKKFNYDGETVLDALTQAQDVPRKFQEFLSAKWYDLPFGNRDIGKSVYGIRYSNMKEYMGSLGVVAALFTTITFTAAFTVPGGYEQVNGTPTMLREAAFQAFMVTDVLGMCSSMMVLFCLVLFLNSGRVEDEGSGLVDLSVTLLQVSFYSTLIAFMTGVYVTTFDDLRGLAIFTLLLGSLVFVSMSKDNLLDLVIPVFYCLLTFFKKLKARMYGLWTHYSRVIAGKFMGCIRGANT